MTAAAKAQPKKGGKSGLRKLKPGETLFNDGDLADSLFIIQKGQIRLFKPKGKGFVEIGVLRAGEVLGEMAYFDNNAAGGKRSCSAASIVSTEAIEISFDAFAKTMSGLNPWFKTIINTLADRLRKTNNSLRELESNNVSNFGGKSGYSFFRNVDIVRMLSLFFLVMKSHGEEKEGKTLLHLNTLKLYTNDVFNVQEVKIEEFVNILKSLGHLELMEDNKGFPKILAAKDLPLLRSLLIFFNSQRNVADEKKLRISYKCEMFLAKILEQLDEKAKEEAVVVADISAIIEDFKKMAINMGKDDLVEAQKAGLVGDVIVEEGKLTASVQIQTLRSQFPAIQMMNAINKVNESRDNAGSKYK